MSDRAAMRMAPGRSGSENTVPVQLHQIDLQPALFAGWQTQILTQMIIHQVEIAWPVIARMRCDIGEPRSFEKPCQNSQKDRSDAVIGD